jgi:hypothetical protein
VLLCRKLAVASWKNGNRQVLDEAIPLVASGTYSMLYFLPGNGTRTSGDSNQNADQDVALALLPKEH